MNSENQTSRFYLPLKNEDEITTQALRMTARVTKRNKFDALLHPETEQELRVAKAYNRELNAHRKALKFANKDDGRKTSYQERVRMKEGYWEKGHFHTTCYANGKQIDTPFGPDLYLGECSKENLELAKYYAMGIVMGMSYKYKRPQIVLTWESATGVGTVMHSVNA